MVQNGWLVISFMSSSQVWSAWSYVLHSAAEGKIFLYLSTYDLLSCGCLLTWEIGEWYLS